MLAPDTRITEYHEKHGDDYGSERSRNAKYKAVLGMFPAMYDTVLDVGCGTEAFKAWLPPLKDYTGIDLLTGTNVLDYKAAHDVVVANGIFYKLSRTGEVVHLIRHMWGLTNEALIFTSLSTWAGSKDEGELVLDPLWTLNFCRKLSKKVAFRHDYLSHDFTIGIYR